MIPVVERYSPEQVSAMTDAELSKAVARVVFGAEMTRGFPSNFAERKPFAMRMGGIIHLWRKDTPFDLPLTPAIASSTLAVLEQMRERWKAEPVGALGRISWEIVEDDDGWTVAAVSGGFLQLAHARASHASIGRAVFEVALRSAQEEAPHVG